MQATDGERRLVLAHQCILCFDFESDCAAEGFRFARAIRRSEFDPGRRQFLITGATIVGGAIVGGALAGLSTMTGSRMAAGHAETITLLRPPGVVDEPGFLRRCIRCHHCIESCPNQAIPLQRLAEKQRTPIRIADIDEKKCVVFKDKRPCLVCEEVCPTPEKAIVFAREERILRSSGPTMLKYPAVVASLCIGCGICQANCPADQVAIVVSRRASMRRATSTLTS